MAIPFSGIITPTSIIFTSLSGKMINVTSAHINFEQIKKTIKEIQDATKITGTPTFIGDDPVIPLRKKLDHLSDVSKTIKKASNGMVEVVDGVVMYDGEPMHNAIADRVIQGLSEGFNMDPYLRFIENLMKNPSKRSVDELYGFIEKSAMGITDDGMIAAYKRVRGDYKDCHSGKFDNSVGLTLEMPRNKVDDNSEVTCSYGFHFCSFTYLRHFGSAGRGDRVMIVKVNPADVVSIPKDYNDAKARCCRYEVIGEYEGDDKEDILATRAVWSGDNDWQRELPKSDWDYSDTDDETSETDEWTASWESSSEVDGAGLDGADQTLQDLDNRVEEGEAITAAMYEYRPNGDFVKVTLTIENVSHYTIYDEALLSDVDDLLAASADYTGQAAKIRMQVVA